MQRPLRDYALLGSASNSSALLRVFNNAGALVGSFTVTPGTTSKMASACSWSGTGWSDTWVAAEVISVANGNVYAAPVDSASVLTSGTGETLVANFNLGELPLSSSADPKPSL